jgi:hypothetical protein
MEIASPAAYASGNRLFDALDCEDRERVCARASVVTLVSGDATQEVGVASPWVFFPIDAVLSVLATTNAGEMCEVGMVGNEGASGIDTATHMPALRTTVCQIAGTAARMRDDAFVYAREHYGAFDALIRASERAHTFATEQLIICNALHSVEKRCARWILAMADRTSADEYALTHEYLGFMLAVRRPAVTIASSRLRDAGAITYRYGILRIIDRPLLESLVCECYAASAYVIARSLVNPTQLKRNPSP